MDCDVWWASTEMYADGHHDLLSDPERDRIGTLRRSEDVARSVLGAALLRIVAGQRLGLAPRMVDVVRRCPDCERPHGRPTLPGTGLHASISHSGDRIAVALTTAPVGVDVEQHNDRLDPAELARLVFAEDEKATSVQDFIAYWTRKESVVKATGDGLRAPLTEVVVTPPGSPPALLRYRGAPPPAATMADLDAGPGYQAALTVLTGGPVTVLTHDAGPLLLG